MTHSTHTYLVYGGIGRTGRHFIAVVLNDGYKVKALVRNPEKIDIHHPNLELVKGSITDYEPIDDLLTGVDFVISMLGDAHMQKHQTVNALFIKKLIPAMRGQAVKRFLYQAGGFTRPYKKELPFMN